ncbi:hypothetical protein CPB86DRAFT_258711 [Serendipita vermifera]|nr:hypothetical protein CPB86DRAFT_258711 [Serendipita vermifera]
MQLTCLDLYYHGCVDHFCCLWSTLRASLSASPSANVVSSLLLSIVFLSTRTIVWQTKLSQGLSLPVFHVSIYILR